VKRFNKEQWVGFILLIGLAFYLAYLLREGDIISFVHPKRIPLMWGTLAGLIVLALYQTTKIFTVPSRKTHFNGLFSIGFVLLCGVLTVTAKESDRLPQNDLQKSMMVALKDQQGTRVSNELLPEEPIDLSDDLQQIPTDVEVFEEANESSEPVVSLEQMRSSDKIVLNNDNYTEVLSDIEQNPDQYLGKAIEVEGFVYRDPQFQPDEFVIARMFMVCCAADTQIIGFMCQWEESDQIEISQWLSIKGVLEVETYETDGQQTFMPVIKVKEAEKLETPENQYVYF
jgi:putative membrane protein